MPGEAQDTGALPSQSVFACHIQNSAPGSALCEQLPIVLNRTTPCIVRAALRTVKLVLDEIA